MIKILMNRIDLNQWGHWQVSISISQRGTPNVPRISRVARELWPRTVRNSKQVSRYVADLPQNTCISAHLSPIIAKCQNAKRHFWYKSASGLQFWFCFYCTSFRSSSPPAYKYKVRASPQRSRKLCKTMNIQKSRTNVD